MNIDLKDILSNSNKDIDNQKVMDYISSQLPQDEMHEVEKDMAADPFVNDAIEGLQDFKPAIDIDLFVHQLNSGLQKQVAKNKKRKQKRKFKDQPYVYFAIILILLLLLICVAVVKNNQKDGPRQLKRPALEKTNKKGLGF